MKSELDNFLVGYLSKRWKVSLEETEKRIEAYRKQRIVIEAIREGMKTTEEIRRIVRKEISDLIVKYFLAGFGLGLLVVYLIVIIRG